jgi:hypothetical protein
MTDDDKIKHGPMDEAAVVAVAEIMAETFQKCEGAKLGNVFEALQQAICEEFGEEILAVDVAAIAVGVALTLGDRALQQIPMAYRLPGVSPHLVIESSSLLRFCEMVLHVLATNGPKAALRAKPSEVH